MKKPFRLVQALLRQPVDRTPIWIMRQAGRYLPEYLRLREQEPDFMDFCKNTELTVEATLQPLRRFDLDAAIVFSDILTIPDAMGVDLKFVKNQGPVINNPIRSQRDLDSLKPVTVEEDLAYVMDTIKGAVQALEQRVPVIGFSGSPWTLACYMVEGGGSKQFFTIRSMLYSQPKLLTALLQRLTSSIIDYLNAQIAAGARAIMLFDTWGGLLSSEDYLNFSLAYMQHIAQHVTREVNGEKIPITFFTKGGGLWLESIAQAGCDAIGLDWTIDLAQAKQRVGDQVALQGNLDPALLLSEPVVIERAVTKIMQAYAGASGHVFNLGHGIDRHTPIENVQAMIAAVRNYSHKVVN